MVIPFKSPEYGERNSPHVSPDAGSPTPYKNLQLRRVNRTRSFSGEVEVTGSLLLAERTISHDYSFIAPFRCNTEVSPSISSFSCCKLSV
jgi:hypothetical protein